MSIEADLIELIGRGVRDVADTLAIEGQLPAVELMTPPQRKFGDFATNIALALSPRTDRSPRELAQAISEALPPAPFLERVEIAGPGFLNLFTTDTWMHESLRLIAAAGRSYGRMPPNGERTQVEFVSANPTGPLTLGHARNAAIGDATARLLEFAGYDVEREYYFNDAGGQMDRFGASVEARYLRLVGREAEVPEDGYHGAYIGELARDILDKHGPALADLEPEARFVRMREEGARRVLSSIADSLKRFGVTFDVYLKESELAERGEIEAAIKRLREGGYVYELDGATWFRATDFGDDKDRVLVRSNGTHTYFGADCAYVIDKFSRGFDHLIYVLGADHHGDVARIKGAATALGYDASKVEMLIYQWVAFLRDGEPVAMSKRAGNFITLDELMDEVGADAARFTLLMFSSDSSMNFDIEAVKKRSLENPVYYVQYGHARIASILRKASDAGIALRPIQQADLTLMVTDEERDLMRALAGMPDQIWAAAQARAPHRLTHVAQDLAARFHRFYTECRVVSDDEALTQARLWLCSSTKQVLGNLLGLLAVSAPESMERSDA